jgi:hypothetical protein
MKEFLILISTAVLFASVALGQPEKGAAALRPFNHVPPRAASNELKNSVASADTVVWVGLDYSLVRMIGGDGSEYDFRVPAAIFPAMPQRWNELFLDERIQRVSYSLGKNVILDIGSVTELNKMPLRTRLFFIQVRRMKSAPQT